jgi:uncharacterized alkaline shock family protein YloU
MIGKVTISPDVVREVARITTLATPGVLAMAERPAGRNNVDPGVSVIVLEAARGDDAKGDGANDDHGSGPTLQIKLHVIAAVNQPLHKLGQQIQNNVAGAIAEIAGMTVTSVDVTFEDVRSQG